MRKTTLIYSEACETRPAFAGLVSRVLLSLSLLAILTHNAEAQWKKLLTKIDADIFVIYFIDHPGPPRVGFVSDAKIVDDTLVSGLRKTTDGGLSWKRIVFPPNSGSVVRDFTFKDSLTGWICGDGCYKTTDGGETWKFCVGSGVDSYGIYYDKKSGGLFLSTFGGLDYNGYGGWNPVSWDEGSTWVSSGVNVGGEVSGGFAFADDDTGLLAWYDYFQDYPWFRTTDGGHSWNSIGHDSTSYQPLAIPGTKTYFANTVWGTIIRTDDAGDTWRVIYSFPPQYRLKNGEDGYTSSGCIRGTLDSLYVMLPSGCYLSIDQGVSWKYLCGQPDLILPDQRFYVKNNQVYIFSVDSTTRSTLWSLDVDSMQYFRTGFAFPDSTKRTIIKAGTAVTLNLTADQSQLGIDSGHIVIRFDSALGLQGVKLPPSWVITDSSVRGGVLELTIKGDSNTELPNPILQLTFNTYLASPSAKIYLDYAHLFGKRLNCDCQALSADGADSVEIDFDGCGDSLLLHYMATGSPFQINSIQPNPLSSTTTLKLSSSESAVAQITIRNLLGTEVARLFSGELSVGEHSFTWDARGLSTGMYECVVRMNGSVQHIPIILER